MIYSIPYVLLILFLMVLSVLYAQHREESVEYGRRLEWVGLSIFFVFFAFRGFIFTDWVTYYVEFDKTTWDDLLMWETGKEMREPGFIVLMNVCKTIFDNYHFFIFVQTSIITWLFVSFLRKYSDNILCSLVVFLCFWGVVIVANLLRNAIALFIMINSFQYIHERKPLAYYTACMTALCFHYSALIFFPLYFFMHRHLNRWVYLAIFAACNVIFLLHIPVFLKLVSLLGIGGDFLENKLEWYTDASKGLGVGFGYLERLITGLLVFCYYDKLNRIRPENSIFINALVAYYVSIFTFSQFPEVANRIGMLFLASYWILWNDLLKCFEFRNNRYLFMSFIGLYCIFKTMTTINQPCNEYDNLLFGIKSYQERKYIFERTFEEPTY